MIPQLIIIALEMIGLGIDISRHGETKKESKHNAWVTLTAKVILWGILYYGGFWTGLI
jgi:hypothetical protein